jgi:hypothetical protein
VTERPGSHGTIRPTRHALARFIERWYPGRGVTQAQRELERLIARSRFVEYTPDRDELWEAPTGMRMVVRADGAVVTVLPPPRRRSPG